MTENRPRSQSPSVASSAAPSRTSPGASPQPSAAPSVIAPAPAVTSSSSIVVAVRKRPKLPSKEQDENDIVRCSDDGGTVVVYEPRTKLDLTPIIEPSSFSFDHVFSEQSTSQEVYEECCRPLLANVRDGGGAVIFAFGQTGSGKTYTMLGDGDCPGLYGLAVTELLGMAGAATGLTASFYEVYGSKLYDLLNDRAEVRMLQDEYKNIHIVGLTERDVCSVEDVNALMTSGQTLRAIGTTHANDRSSRSHAVLEIKVRPDAAAAGDTAGRITFVDLAGSERASDTAETNVKTRREGAEINKSLLALKECIRAMSMRKRHIPFRGSKLTQILCESFTGRCRTCMIATISPCQSHCEDTLNTLRYSDRIKELKGPAGGGAGTAGLQTPTPCRNCGLPIFVGDRHVCRRQVVECPHCRREMDKNELEQHVAECKDVPLRCPHCNERMLRADQPRHNRRCQRLPMRCPDCERFVPRHLIEKHTLTECGGAKEKCRHCNLPFPRQSLAAHEGGCDAMRVACPHCLRYVRQKRLAAHTAVCFLNPNRTAAAQGRRGSTTAVTGTARISPVAGGAAGGSNSNSPARMHTRSHSLNVSLSQHQLCDAAAMAAAVPVDSVPTVATPGRERAAGTGGSLAKFPAGAALMRDSAGFGPGTNSNGSGNGNGGGEVDGAGRRQLLAPPPQQRVAAGGECQTSCALGAADSSTSGSPTQCPYARYGCPVRVSRLSLQAHLHDTVEEHLRLVTCYADSVDTQNAELRRLVVSRNQ